MGMKHWILPKNHFKTHLFSSIFGWGDPSQLGPGTRFFQIDFHSMRFCAWLRCIQKNGYFIQLKNDFPTESRFCFCTEDQDWIRDKPFWD